MTDELERSGCGLTGIVYLGICPNQDTQCPGRESNRALPPLRHRGRFSVQSDTDKDENRPLLLTFYRISTHTCPIRNQDKPYETTDIDKLRNIDYIP
jgi:hypothetical protein